MYVIDKKQTRFLFLFILFILAGLFLLTYGFSICEEKKTGHMKIFAVSSSGEGIAADLYITISPGNGSISTTIGNSLVDPSTQMSVRNAYSVMKYYFSERDLNKCNVEVNIVANAEIVQGPSAGAAMALLLYSLLANKDLEHLEKVGVTGTINKDGTVGQVGGVYQKGKAAASVGIKLFIIPKGEEKAQIIDEDGELKEVDLRSYFYKKYGMKVVSVSTLDECISYAFRDINSIDVNEETEEEKIEVEGINADEELEAFKEFTEKYIEDVNREILEIKKEIEEIIKSKKYENPYINELLNFYSAAIRNLREARKLYEKNYLYSAANNAYLSIVYARAIRDVVKNPSLLNANSTIYTLMISELNKKIDELMEKFDEGIKEKNMEWFIGGEMRLLWTKKFETDNEIIVKINNGTISPKDVLNRLFDLEYSREWLNIAEKLYNLSYGKTILRDDSLREKCIKKIVSIENRLSLLSSLVIEDNTTSEFINRHLSGAKAAKMHEWYEACITNADIALSTLDYLEESPTLGGEEVKERYEELKKDLEQKLSSNRGYFVWARLFLEHSIYFYRLGEEYEKRNHKVSAINNYKQALYVLYISKGYYNGFKEIREALNIKPVEQTKEQNKQSNETRNQKNFNKTKETKEIDLAIVLSLLSFSILLLIALYFIFKEIKSHKVHKKEEKSIIDDLEIKNEIDELKKMLKELDKRFIEGKISESLYKSLRNKYRKELRELEKKRQNILNELYEIEKIKADLEAAKHMLEVIREHYKKGWLTSEEYRDELKKYREKIEKLNKLLKKKKSEGF